MRADRNAPVLGAGEVETAADPDTVWVVLADIQGWPSWNPDITDATLRGPLQPGMTFSWKSGPGTITSTFLIVEQPTKLSWTGKTIVSTEESWGGLQVAPGKWGCTGSYRNAGGGGNPGRVRQRQRADDATGAELQASGKSRTAGRQVR